MTEEYFKRIEEAKMEYLKTMMDLMERSNYPWPSNMDVPDDLNDPWEYHQGTDGDL